MVLQVVNLTGKGNKSRENDQNSKILITFKSEYECPIWLVSDIHQQISMIFHFYFYNSYDLLPYFFELFQHNTFFSAGREAFTPRWSRFKSNSAGTSTWIRIHDRYTSKAAMKLRKNSFWWSFFICTLKRRRRFIYSVAYDERGTNCLKRPNFCYLCDT